ncbi:MAG: hypothetical protein PVG79_01420 [Gemmatimonadales bacterium]|jgi:hypothetical protein
MEFGFGFWVLFIVLFIGCGKACGWGRRKYKEHQRELEERQSDDDRLTTLEDRVRGLGRGRRERHHLIEHAVQRRGEGRQPEPVRRGEKAPTQLEILQQKFIEGRLSLEEYERELDRLDKLE